MRETAERVGGTPERVTGTSERVAGTPERVTGTSERVAAEEIADLATALVRANEALGVMPDGWTPSARWKREVDIPEEVLGRVRDQVLVDGVVRR